MRGRGANTSHCALSIRRLEGYLVTALRRHKFPFLALGVFCDGQLVVGLGRSVGGVLEFLSFGLDYRPRRAADAQS